MNRELVILVADGTMRAVLAAFFERQFHHVLSCAPFDFNPRLYHEPSKKPATIFEQMVPKARARLAAEEEAPSGKGAKADGDRRLLVATLLLLGEQLGASLVSVGLEAAPKKADLFARVVDRAFA